MLKGKLKLWLLAPAIALSISVIKPAFSGGIPVIDGSLIAQANAEVAKLVEVYNRLTSIYNAINEVKKSVNIVEDTIRTYTQHPSQFLGQILFPYIKGEIRNIDWEYNRTSNNTWNAYGNLSSSSIMNKVSDIDSPVIVSLDDKGNPIITTATGKKVDVDNGKLETYISGILTSPDPVEFSKLEGIFKDKKDDEVKRAIMSMRAKKSEVRAILLDSYLSLKKVETYKNAVDSISKRIANGVDAGEMEKLRAQLIALDAMINSEIAKQVANQNKLQAIVGSNNIAYEEAQRINLLKAYEAVKNKKK
jgi:flagellar biosynthesis chaperone FliJ